MPENEKKMSRRNFLAVGGGVLGSLAATGCGKKESPAPAPQPEPVQVSAAFPEDVPYCGFRMGVQSYCFREFKSTEEVIGLLKTLKLAHVELWPGGHLPVDLPEDQLNARVAQYRDAGITIDACGVLALPNDEAELRKIFSYAKTLGVLSISAAPEYEAIPLLDNLTGEYDIPIAIHNHGPNDELWGTPDKIREHLAGTSTRIGLCPDLGHFNRAGFDYMPVIEEFADRINGMHLKDMVPNPEGEWVDEIVGRGKVNLPVLLTRLKEIGFKGSFSLEYESDPSNPIPAMQECLQEIRNACTEIS
ncbi:MAG: sugar phosphate isomerase/epimerase [Candidatus Glassbacteria bacterium]|nr:sugar phosphate isomerase/epimerase [Candidatus Glassbacteria bacterium]